MRHVIAGPSAAGADILLHAISAFPASVQVMLLSSLQGCHVFIFLDSVTCNSMSHNQRTF